MRIVVPLTDYIPASIMTEDGDMVSRRDGIAAREQCYGYGYVKQSLGADTNLGNLMLAGLNNLYFKGSGAAAFAAFSGLALRDTGVHIGNNTRNVGGNQVIAGVGFESSAIIFLAADDVPANMNWSVGFSNGDNDMCLQFYTTGTDVAIDNAFCMHIDRAGANALFSVVSAIGADGFTLDWTLLGACVLDFTYICLP